MIKHKTKLVSGIKCVYFVYKLNFQPGIFYDYGHLDILLHQKGN